MSTSTSVNFFNKLTQLLAKYIVAIIAVLTIWVISLAGGFSGIEGLVYDYITRHPLKKLEYNQHVLMVEIDYENQNRYNDNWINIITSFNKLGAKEIVFTFFPKDAPAKFYQFVSQNPNIIFGRKIVPKPENVEQFVLEPLPLAAKIFRIPFGVVHIPSNRDGIYRSQSFYASVEGKALPLLEVVSAEQFYGKTLAFNDDSYLINFQEGEENLSKINIERILSNNIISDLVSNKVIIIGFSKERNEIGLHTPATASNEMISPLAFHAFALNTLLNNNQINQLNAIEKLLLFTLILIFVSGSCIYLEMKILIWVSAGLTLLFTALTVLALQHSHFWIPIVETLLIQYIFLLIFFRQKLVLESNAIRKTVINLSLELQERTYPTSFFNLQDPWAQVVVMIDQLFTLTRLIILERVHGDNHIIEVKALRSTLTDIHEKRRDYEREPYLTCIKEKSPCVVKGYFKNQKTASELQYLVPLIFSGEVIGFLALGIEEKTVALNKNFSVMIQEFSDKISELLYRAQVWRELHKTPLSTWRNFKIFENEPYFYNKLYKSIALLDKHLLVLENLFNGLSTAAILYDLFGRMIKLNASMSTLLQSQGIAPFNITVLDLIVATSYMNYEEARQCLQNTIMQNKHFVFPAKLVETEGQSYVVKVCALAHEKTHSEYNVESNKTFVVKGVLLELVNISDLDGHYKLKENLIKNIFYKIEKSIAPMLEAFAVVKNKKLSFSDSAIVIEDCYRKLTELEHFTLVAKDFICKNHEIDNLSLYPVDIIELLNTAIRKSSPVADMKRLQIMQELPNVSNLVYASPDTLRGLLIACLEYLIEDAVEDGKLVLILTEESGMLRLRLENKGFGMPKEKFDNYFLGKEEASPQKLAEIFAIIPLVQDWGGELKAGCEVGVGTYFNLTLKEFM